MIKMFIDAGIEPSGKYCAKVVNKGFVCTAERDR